MEAGRCPLCAGGGAAAAWASAASASASLSLRHGRTRLHASRTAHVQHAQARPARPARPRAIKASQGVKDHGCPTSRARVPGGSPACCQPLCTCPNIGTCCIARIRFSRQATVGELPHVRWCCRSVHTCCRCGVEAKSTSAMPLTVQPACQTTSGSTTSGPTTSTERAMALPACLAATWKPDWKHIWIARRPPREQLPWPPSSGLRPTTAQDVARAGSHD